MLKVITVAMQPICDRPLEPGPFSLCSDNHERASDSDVWSDLVPPCTSFTIGAYEPSVVP